LAVTTCSTMASNNFSCWDASLSNNKDPNHAPSQLTLCQSRWSSVSLDRLIYPTFLLELETIYSSESFAVPCWTLWSYKWLVRCPIKTKIKHTVFSLAVGITTCFSLHNTYISFSVLYFLKVSFCWQRQKKLMLHCSFFYN
jgi:hypothetical protein